MTDGPFPFTADPPIRETVTAVLTPIDGFSRRPVRTGVTATLCDPDTGIVLAGRIVRNRSGSLVLVNRPRDASYTFRLDPSVAGYRSPVEVTFTPAADGLEQVIRLEPLATFPFDAGTTLIRGMVARGRTTDGSDRPIAAPGVRITALPDGGGPTSQWSTTTDARGGFALPLRLPLAPGELPTPQPVRLRFEDGARTIELTRNVTEGQLHVFADVVDLTSNAPQPPFQSVE